MQLSEFEQRTLLSIARDSLHAYLSGVPHALEAYPLTPALQEKQGCFVTVLHRGELRGCIGHIRALLPLAEGVRENAVNAASRDPRFDPITLDEMPQVSFSISVLLPGEEPGSPFIRVRDVSEIVIGRDGVYLDHAGPRGGGLLLPSVAVDQGWNVEQFLTGLCKKAGVADTYWRQPDAQLFRFSTQTFKD